MPHYSENTTRIINEIDVIRGLLDLVQRYATEENPRIPDTASPSGYIHADLVACDLRHVTNTILDDIVNRYNDGPRQR